MLVVCYRLRYQLSLRDLAELFLERGLTLTQEARFAPVITDQVRRRRRGQAGIAWHVDETDVRVQGKWCYWYRAIDQDGNLVDSMLSQKRDRDAAKRFFQQALQTVGQAPERVITDGHRSYPRAIRAILGKDVLHPWNHSLNNQLEQDHRGLKQRYDPMRGFGSFPAASRFCRACDAVRQFVRIRTTMKQPVSLHQQRERLLHRWVALQALVQAVYQTEAWVRSASTRFVCFLCSQF